MQAHVTSDPAALPGAAREWLEADPVRGTVPLSAIDTLLSGVRLSEEPAFLAWVCDAGQVVGVAVHTPPHLLCVPSMPEQAAVALADALKDTPLPGVVGTAGPAVAFAEVYARHRGVAGTVTFRELQYRLDAVRRPRREVAGTVREALPPADDDLLLDWIVRFAEDAGVPQERRRDPRTVLEGRRAVGGRYWLWERDGVPCCVVGHTPPQHGVPRIGPVFTPRELRGQGYAQALTAWVAQRLLDDGARAVTLFADAANPASNAAYVAVGFEPVEEAVELAFGAPTG